MGLTQEQFARLLHVSFTTISRWENGHTEPTGVGETLLDMLAQARAKYEDASLIRVLGDTTNQSEVITELARLVAK
jgi:transcriptional regulator with XRE-family HTH domain